MREIRGLYICCDAFLAERLFCDISGRKLPNLHDGLKLQSFLKQQRAKR
jgi:hypothetical protein